MKTRLVLFVFLMVTVASCTPATKPPPTATYTPIQPTLILEAPTEVPTPLPTQPKLSFLMTPDAIQVERWQEYQTELAKCVLANVGCLSAHTTLALCEWDILGRSNQELYLWVMCSTSNSYGENPVVVYLEPDGSIRKVKAVHYGSDREASIKRMFPADVQNKINAGNNSYGELGLHLVWREEHWDEQVPPLIILSATIVATPLPVEPNFPDYILTPNVIQVESWKKYQSELIKSVLSGYSPTEYSSSLCEWDILGQSGQDVYVWAYCGFIDGGSRATPAIIHLDTSGSIQSVETPRSGDAVTSDIQRMFPADVREKLIYYSPPSPYMGRPEVLRLHLLDRLKNLVEAPPLIILSATSQP